MDEITKRPRGRPATNYKHGFYSNKFRPCSTCPKMKDNTCPYFHMIPKKEHMYKHMFDEFGVNRCVPESNYFENLKKTFTEKFDLEDSDMPLLEKMCMIIVRSGRVEEYIADQGLTQKRMLKDDKSGMVFETEIQNILKKDAYFEDKMLREWMQNLKIARNARDPKDNEDDIALILTSEVKTTKKLIVSRKALEQIQNGNTESVDSGAIEQPESSEIRE